VCLCVCVRACVRACVLVGGGREVSTNSGTSRGRRDIRSRCSGDEEKLPRLQRSLSQHARHVRVATNRLASGFVIFVNYREKT